mgnify:CR=1 FL=1
MNGDEVTASRADANDFEPASPSTAVSILTKTSFRAGHVTQKFDSNGLSDLFVTSPGENSDAGTLYRIDRATGDVTAINASLNDSTEEGPWVAYHDNGQLWFKGTYKDGKEDGPWFSYHDNGQLWWKRTYKDGERDGPYVFYHENGQLWKKEDPWVFYQEDGTVIEYWSGTFKNGVKISD